MSSRFSRIIMAAVALWCAACDSSEEPRGAVDGDADMSTLHPGDEDSGATDDPSDADGEPDAEDAAAESDAAEALDGDAPEETPLDADKSDAGCADCSVEDAQMADVVAPAPDATIPDLIPLVGGDGAVLPFRVADAEYSDALERIVIVTSPPNRLILLDPESFALAEVGLPLTPTSLSVAPDGLSAAVGHNGFVSIVALSSLTVLHTHPVNVGLSDVVLAGNGYVYALPRGNGWVELHSIQIGSGAETSGSTIYGGTVARLHPAGDRMYGADRGISPADIERYDITQGTGALAYDSPYHGDYGMCGDLWFSQDGARIFTACGNVFRASNVRAEDMTYSGALEGAPGVRHLDHSSAARLVATVHGYGIGPLRLNPGAPTVGEVAIYEDRYLTRRQRATLPRFQTAARQYASEGRYAFFNAHGTRLYVLVEAESAASMVDNQGLARFTLGGPAGEVGLLGVAPELAPTPPASGAPSAGISLGFRVIDAEYSRALDRIVAVSDAPDRLLIVNPADGSMQAVALPLAASAIGLHAGGHQAAVAHDGWISIVDLDQRALTHSLPVSAPLQGVVFGSGYVYGFPGGDRLRAIHSVKISDGSVTLSGLMSITSGMVARLHPAGDRMYRAGSDVERYDVTSGPAVFAYDSPYTGEYSTCGDQWFSEDGLRIFTACGNVFRASNVRADDMTYAGALPGPVAIAHLDHSQAAARVAVAIRPVSGITSGTGVTLFDHQSLNQLRTHPASALTLSGTSYATNSRFVFFNTAGTKLYVLSDAVGAPVITSSILAELAF